jgi:fumarylacetoacetase
MLNETHDPALRSWVASANLPDADFPLQNLPYGVFRRRDSSEAFRGGVAIGDMILDLPAALAQQVFDGAAAGPALQAGASTLNGLMALGPPAWAALRLALSRLLREASPHAGRLRGCLVAQRDAVHAVPAQIGDYTDFFTSEHHMLNAGRVFRPEAPALPNFKWLPIAYHGRASSIEISGTAFRRPCGQSLAQRAQVPSFGPARQLDHELELGVFIGPGNPRGEPVPIGGAEDHAFGLCLLNDWSARDLQGWEALPLGPFLAKSFITTISPWIVTLEALAPFRLPVPRAAGDPPTLAHLQAEGDGALGAFGIELESRIVTRRTGPAGAVLSRTSYRHAYWSVAQMIAHHTSNGCNLRPGDLLGTGTQSGPAPGEQGCLLELGHGGREPVQLPTGETRAYLEDGDTIVLRGWCERAGHARIGFGECRGTVLPAAANNDGRAAAAS